jgi:hypothetical protein
MTLIAMTVNTRQTDMNTPIIIGDILISSELKSDTAIPTFVKSVDGLLDSNAAMFPADLRQKMYIINDRLCAAFAGSVYEIKLFLEDLKLYFKYHEVSQVNLNTFLDQYDKNAFKESTYIICLLENTNNQTSFFYRWGEFWDGGEVPYFGLSYAAGSGKKDFLRFIAEIAPGRQKKGIQQGLENTEPLKDMIGILCHFLGHERITIESIKKHWGAGFEVVFIENGKFKKFENITYILWNCDILENGRVGGLPYTIISNRYDGEILWITCREEGKTLMFAVPPIDYSGSATEKFKVGEEIEILFDQPTICSCFILRDTDGLYHFASIVSYQPDRAAGSIKIFPHEDHLLVYINDDYKKLISRTINAEWIMEGNVLPIA